MNVSSAILLAAFAIVSSAAPAREFLAWRSADGSRTLTGAFVSLKEDLLTIDTREGKTLTFTLDKLDEASRQRAHALTKAAIPPLERLTAFDGFTLGSSIEDTGKVVKNIPGVKGNLPPELLGRTGLNGVYSLTLAGVQWSYFFGWSADNTLTDISLHGPAQPAAAAAAVKDHRAKLHAVMTAQFGEPALCQDCPDLNSLEEGKLVFHEAWQCDDRFIYLGTGKIDGKISCVLRCASPPPPPAKKSGD